MLPGISRYSMSNIPRRTDLIHCYPLRRRFCKTSWWDLDERKSKKPSENINTSQAVGYNTEQVNFDLLKSAEAHPMMKSVKASIIGLPNAGKSTLINSLIDRQLMAASKKVDTTMRNNSAILTIDNTQVVLVDTPGFVDKRHVHRHRWPRETFLAPREAVKDADVLVVVVDAANRYTRRKIDVEILLALLSNYRKRSVLVLNKIDLLRKNVPLLLGLSEELSLKGSRWFIRKSQKDLINTFLTTATKSVESLSHGDLDNLPINYVDGESLHSLAAPTDEMAEQDIALVGKSGVVLSKQYKEIICEKACIAEDDVDRFSDKELSVLYDLDVPIPTRAKPLPRRPNSVRRLLNIQRGFLGFDRVFMTSSLHQDGTGELIDYLFSQAVYRQWEYHASIITDQLPEQLVANVVRQLLMDTMPLDVPYKVDHKTVLMEKSDSGHLHILHHLLCYRDVHRRMLIGQDGDNILSLQFKAKQLLNDIFRCEVNLKLIVKFDKTKRLK